MASFKMKALYIYSSDKNGENRKCACLQEGLKCCNECKCRFCGNTIVDFEEEENDEQECF